MMGRSSSVVRTRGPRRRSAPTRRVYCTKGCISGNFRSTPVRVSGCVCTQASVDTSKPVRHCKTVATSIPARTAAVYGVVASAHIDRGEQADPAEVGKTVRSFTVVSQIFTSWNRVGIGSDTLVDFDNGLNRPPLLAPAPSANGAALTGGTC
jgi:hypothetical protein